nr:MAG TPA: hypothetical protein [Caudoviricetes sp.]
MKAPPGPEGEKRRTTQARGASPKCQDRIN